MRPNHDKLAILLIRSADFSGGPRTAKDLEFRPPLLRRCSVAIILNLDITRNIGVIISQLRIKILEKVAEVFVRKPIAMSRAPTLIQVKMILEAIAV